MVQANTVLPLQPGAAEGFCKIFPGNAGFSRFNTADVLRTKGEYFAKPAASKIKAEINAARI
ncbi:MAG: hypothetical protein ACYCTD_04225 [bacterium]